MSTASTASKRLLSELRKLQKDPPAGISANIPAANVMNWDAMISGPEDTPFEGGVFRLKLIFPKDYPQRAPFVWFFSKMFHPNVYEDGRICLDILEEPAKWSPNFEVGAVLMGIQAMLGDPNPLSPANPKANFVFTTNPKEYKRKVREIVDQSQVSGDDDMNENLGHYHDPGAASAGQLQLFRAMLQMNLND